MATGIDGIEHELEAQRGFLASREPPYARALELLVEAVRGEFGGRLAEVWKTRNFNAFYERPLLLLAAIRYDALCEGPGHPLFAAFAGSAPSVDAVTPQAVAHAVGPDREGFLTALRQRAVQTNETTRAVTWLWPLHLLAEGGEDRSVSLVDLGTSAGLNLVADELPAIWTGETGEPLAVDPRLPVVLRLGFDVSPLDVLREDAAVWLRACVWPSDAPRLERLEQGIERFRRRAPDADGPRLEARSLPECPPELVTIAGKGLLVCTQTIVRDYLGDAAREAYERAMHDLISRREPLSTLWLELELHPGGGSFERAAAIIAHFLDRDGAGRAEVLAQTHPHPKQIFPNGDAVRNFVAAFGARRP